MKILKDILIMNLKNDYSVEIQMNGEPEVFYRPLDHPWVEMPTDDSVDKEIRYSLDELRIR